MPEFVIEREIPSLGSWSPEQLSAAAKTSCSVLPVYGPEVQWLQSFVTDDKMYCIYIAPDEAAVREHARLGGFRRTRSRSCTLIDPATW